jgi:hypothetical protein
MTDNISTSIQLCEILYTDSQYMLVRYFNCCTDWSKSLGNYGYIPHYPLPTLMFKRLSANWTLVVTMKLLIIQLQGVSQQIWQTTSIKWKYTLLDFMSQKKLKWLYFYLWVLHPVAYLSNWFFMTPSIATKFQYINSLLFSFFTHYMFRPLWAILRWWVDMYTIDIHRLQQTHQNLHTTDRAKKPIINTQYEWLKIRNWTHT